MSLPVALLLWFVVSRVIGLFLIGLYDGIGVLELDGPDMFLGHVAVICMLEILAVMAVVVMIVGSPYMLGAKIRSMFDSWRDDGPT